MPLHNLQNSPFKTWKESLIVSISLILAFLIMSLVGLKAQSEMTVEGADIYVATQIVPATELPDSYYLAIWKAANITSDSFQPKTDWVIDIRTETSTLWIEIEYSTDNLYRVSFNESLAYQSSDFDRVTDYIAKEIYRFYTGKLPKFHMKK